MQNAETVSELPEWSGFIADRNVSRLAQWMRALGYDTLFLDSIDDRDLIRIGHCPACQRTNGRGTDWEPMRQFRQGLTLRDAPLSPQFMAPVPNGKKA